MAARLDEACAASASAGDQLVVRVNELSAERDSLSGQLASLAEKSEAQLSAIRGEHERTLDELRVVRDSNVNVESQVLALNATNELLSGELTALRTQIAELAEQRSHVAAQLEQTSVERDSLQAQVATLGDKVRSLGAQLEQTTSESEAKLAQVQREHASAVQALLEQHAQQSTTRESEATQRVTEIEAQLSALGAQLVSLGDEKRSLGDELERRSLALAETREHSDKQVGELSVLVEALRVAQQELKENAAAELEAQRAELEANATRLSGEVIEAEASKRQLMDELATLREESERARAESGEQAATSAERIALLESELQQLGEQAADAESAQSQLKSDYEATIDDLKEMIGESDRTLEASKCECARLRAKCDELEAELRETRDAIAAAYAENNAAAAAAAAASVYDEIGEGKHLTKYC